MIEEKAVYRSFSPVSPEWWHSADVYHAWWCVHHIMLIIKSQFLKGKFNYTL